MIDTHFTNLRQVLNYLKILEIEYQVLGSSQCGNTISFPNIGDGKNKTNSFYHIQSFYKEGLVYCDKEAYSIIDFIDKIAKESKKI